MGQVALMVKLEREREVMKQSETARDGDLTALSRVCRHPGRDAAAYWAP